MVEVSRTAARRRPQIQLANDEHVGDDREYPRARFSSRWVQIVALSSQLHRRASSSSSLRRDATARRRPADHPDSFVQWTAFPPLPLDRRLVLSPGSAGTKGTEKEAELRRYVTDYLTVDGRQW